MTIQQIKEAVAMHDNGINWNIIASYFGVTQKTLMKYRKHYGLDKKIHGVTA